MGRPFLQPGGQVGSGVQVAAPGRVGRRRSGKRVEQVDGWVVSGLCGGPGQVQ